MLTCPICESLLALIAKDMRWTVNIASGFFTLCKFLVFSMYQTWWRMWNTRLYLPLFIRAPVHFQILRTTILLAMVLATLECIFMYVYVSKSRLVSL